MLIALSALLRNLPQCQILYVPHQMDASLKRITLSLCRKKTRIIKKKTLLPYSVVEKKMAQELNNDGLSESKNCRKKQ